MHFFKYHQAKINFLFFWLIGYIYLISISQISSKHLQKRILFQNKTYIINNTNSAILNITNEEKKSKRKTNDYYPKNYNDDLGNFNEAYNNTDNSTKNNTSSFEEDPGTYLLGYFLIFFMMGLYLICEMKKYEQTRNRTKDVWLFIYFSDIGILSVAGVNIFDIKNLFLDSSPFGFSSLVFLIMSFYYLSKLIKNCNPNYGIQFFSCDTVGEWGRLPCFIWSLLSLTDPCCKSTSYTVTYYSDGHTESNYWFHVLWNCFIKYVKICAFFFTVISFYFGFLFFLFFWVLAKLLFHIIIKCKGISIETQNGNNAENIQNENPINVLPNINQNIQINNEMYNPQPNVINNQIIIGNINNNISNITNNYENNMNRNNENIRNNSNRINKNRENNRIDNDYRAMNSDRIDLQNRNELPEREDVITNSCNLQNNEITKGQVNKPNHGNNNEEISVENFSQINIQDKINIYNYKKNSEDDIKNESNSNKLNNISNLENNDISSIQDKNDAPPIAKNEDNKSNKTNKDNSFDENY